MVHDLLPVSTEAHRCSEFARLIGVLPPGTGLFLSRAYVVTVPLPWPKPALNHSWITSAATLVAHSDEPSRLFAAEPTNADIVVEIYERSPSGAVLYRWNLDSHATIEPLAELAAAAPLGELAHVDCRGATPDVMGAPAPPTLLICTQGGHDLCCGESGVAFADQIERSRPDYTVRRVSHTGGHRFAPTLLAFPEGRMWAYADLDLIDRIASGAETAQDLSTRSRGWWGARVGAAQVAETAARIESLDRPFEPPTIEQIDVDAGETPAYVVTNSTGSWRINVSVGRQVPSIACEAPGGLPAKPGREFAWSLAARDETLAE